MKVDINEKSKSFELLVISIELKSINIKLFSIANSLFISKILNYSNDLSKRVDF